MWLNKTDKESCMTIKEKVFFFYEQGTLTQDQSIVETIPKFTFKLWLLIQFQTSCTQPKRLTLCHTLPMVQAKQGRGGDTYKNTSHNLGKRY